MSPRTITAATGGQLIKAGAGTLQLNTTTPLNLPVVLNAGHAHRSRSRLARPGASHRTPARLSGTLTNQGTFTYNGGTFTGQLINEGTFTYRRHISPPATASINFGSFTVGAAQSVTANGSGLDNQGTLTLTGGTIDGNGPFINEFGANLIARGTIANAFTNNGTMTLTGVLTLTGAATNYGSITSLAAPAKAFAPTAA